MQMEEMRDPRSQMIALLKMKSVKFGKFQLSSGKESDFFIDCKQSILTAPGHVWAGQLMLEIIAVHFRSAVAVAGVEIGGCPLASAVSLLSAVTPDFQSLDALYVRKEKKDHGTKNLVEGSQSLPQGSQVVLLEDVFTTGGSALRAVKAIREANLDVIGVIGLVDRLEGATEAFEEAGVRSVSVLSRSDLED